MFAAMRGGDGLNLLATAGIPEVQKRAGLSEAQISAVAELREKSREAMGKVFADIAAGGGDRRAVLAKIREKIQAQQEEINGELKKVLREKHAKMVELAAGLALRQNGPAALATREVAELVGLNKEVTEQIEKIVADGREQLLGALGEISGQGRAALAEKRDALRKEANAKIGKLVTESQKKKIEELMAAVEGIEMPRAPRRGGRGGAGGGGGPG